MILERIVKEHEKQRKVWREMGVGGDCAKDLIDILLDISKDENAEMKLTRNNIKTFVLVVLSFIVVSLYGSHEGVA